MPDGVPDGWHLALFASLALAAYAYAGYPLLLLLAGALRRRPRPPSPAAPAFEPRVSILLPVYNEAANIRSALEHLTQLDYPAERRQIVVVSDASTDRTDAIVRQFAGRGVELLRLPRRGGKTAAQNAARPHLRGEIVVGTDASVRVPSDALRPLLAPFADPSVGVASGHDVSVSVGAGARSNPGESGYVGYDMWVRELETRVSGIVGASGCFYAVRAALTAEPLPPEVSTDFAAVLVARERGYRAVAVRRAVCYVPRVASLQVEYRRKVRTITRGLATLIHKRGLLNPFRHGAFAWMLFSHKLCRWLVPWAGAAALVALVVLSGRTAWAAPVLGAVGLGLAAAALGWLWPSAASPSSPSRHRAAPAILTLAAYAVSGNLAVVRAWINTMRGELATTWEPSRRSAFPP